MGVVAALAVVGVWWRARDGGTGDGTIRSIAVLPFENKSGDTTFDYLEDGITDQVRDALNAIPGLTVKARASSQRLKGHDAREVGMKLGVGVVLQGTVSRSSSRLHVTTELVRTSDDNAFWSRTFDVQPAELAGLQDSVAHAVADRLSLAHAAAPTRGLGARGTRDAEAYDLFLRGRHAFDAFDYARAESLFQHAVARDPLFARALAYLAITYANSPGLGVGSLDASFAAARTAADRALALDSTVAEAYIAQSFILGGDLRWTDQLKPLERALMIDSSNVEVRWAYGYALAQLGRVEDGLKQSRLARERDPLSQTAVGVMPISCTWHDSYEQALPELRATFDLDRTNPLARRGIGYLYAFTGVPDSAVKAFEDVYKQDSTVFGGRSNLVFGYAVAGRWKDARRERALLERESGGNSPNYMRMVADIAFGEYDAAMTALERGLANREGLLGGAMISCDPLYDPLKTNPRFTALMTRFGARVCPARGTWPISSPAASAGR